MRKWLIVLSLTPLMGVNKSLSAIKDLELAHRQLEAINLETRPSWKLVYLENALSEKEKIEALDQAIYQEIKNSRNFDLERQLLASRKLTSGEQIATLNYLFPSQQKRIDVLTTKLIQKIDLLKEESLLEEAGY